MPLEPISERELKGVVREKKKMKRRGENHSMSTTVQTLLFPTAHWTPAKACAWAKKHKFRCTKYDLTIGYVRIRQRSPKSFLKGSFRTIPFGESGIQAVIGHEKGRAKEIKRVVRQLRGGDLRKRGV